MEEDKILAINESGFVKKIAISDLDEFSNCIVKVTDANHEDVIINSNNIVNIVEEVSLSGPYISFNLKWFNSPTF